MNSQGKDKSTFLKEKLKGGAVEYGFGEPQSSAVGGAMNGTMQEGSAGQLYFLVRVSGEGKNKRSFRSEQTEGTKKDPMSIRGRDEADGAISKVQKKGGKSSSPTTMGGRNRESP